MTAPHIGHCRSAGARCLRKGRRTLFREGRTAQTQRLVDLLDVEPGSLDPALAVDRQLAKEAGGFVAPPGYQ